MMKNLVLVSFLSVFSALVWAMPEDASHFSDHQEEKSHDFRPDSSPEHQPQNADKVFTQDSIDIQVEAVDYTKKTMVFYKNKCEDGQSYCYKNPVLTNIKSVIFDYAHQRGIFAKTEKSQQRALSNTP